MKFEDYKEQVLEDALQRIEWGDYDYCNDFEEVYDDMFLDDGITGNGSGSYTFNTWQAEQNTAGLVYDEDFIFELKGMGYTLDVFEQGAESVDVIARCLALPYVMSDIEYAWHERKEEQEDNEEAA